MDERQSAFYESNNGFNETVNISDVLSQLAPIPSGWVRMTHFTDKESTKNIMDGDFNHSPGFLSSKTDAYSSLEQIKEVLTTGNIGAFNRSSFGDYVVLVDLDAQEHKKRLKPGSMSAAISNGNVVGYIQILDVKGKKKYQFFANKNYSPIVSEVVFAKPLVLPKRQSADQSELDFPKTDRNVDDDILVAEGSNVVF